MTYRHLYRRSRSLVSAFSANHLKQARHATAVATVLLATLPCLAQDQTETSSQPNQPSTTQSEPKDSTVTIPAGTRLALVLTQPVQSRNVRRGDDVYAQITSPVNSGNETVIPPGTFVQGTVDKIERRGRRGELRLQSMAITFPDGYVVPIAGPITVESVEGYAIQDPGQRRFTSALILPVAGVGLGALIGHSVGTSSSTVTTPFPPGCIGVPPFCGTTSVYNPGSKFKDTAIGASIGGFAGMIASISMLVSSRHFFLDVGSPVEMTLQQPVTLQQTEVAQAIQQSEQHPVAEQPIAPRPRPLPPPDTPTDHGTCYTPGTPGTPPTVIPGAPGPDGIPGPPTIIPGTPPTPGTPYPCP